MKNVLPFTRRSPPVSDREIKFYQLQDDAMCKDGKGPRAGDICSVLVGVEEAGCEHMAITKSGQRLCGTLSFDGQKVILDFLNPDFPRFSDSRHKIDIIGKVEQFFCATCPPSSTERPVFSVGELSSKSIPVLTGAADHPLDRIVNLWCDAHGVLIRLSDSWYGLHDRGLEDVRTFGYLDLIHPDDRIGITQKWIACLAAKIPLAASFRSATKFGYMMVRILAVPVGEGFAATLLYYGD